MTKPKPIADADTRVYTSSSGHTRAVVTDGGVIKSYEESYRVRCTVQEQNPDGTWRNA